VARMGEGGRCGKDWGTEYLQFCFDNFNRAGDEGSKHAGASARYKCFEKLGIGPGLLRLRC
jgi:hypothetical protein